MINKTYKNKQVQEKIIEIIIKEGSIQLQDFLTKKLKIPKLKKEYIPQLYSYKTNKYKLSKEIKGFLETITNKKVKSTKIFQFKHKDYTIINDKLKEKEGYKIILELTEKWNQESGGYTSIIENNKETLRINPIYNSLTIIKTNEKTKSFIKYINNKANNKRKFIEIN